MNGDHATATPPTFWACVSAAVALPEFVENFDRLFGHSLSTMALRSPLDRMIDEATGRDREAIVAFLAFIFECVFLPLQPLQPDDGAADA